MAATHRCEKSTCGCKATKMVTVIYGKGFNGPDQDILILCEDHAKSIKADAQRHGYKVKEREL